MSMTLRAARSERHRRTRRGPATELVPPVHLLLARAGHETRREHLPECGVVLAPADPHEPHDGFALAGRLRVAPPLTPRA